MRQKTTNVAAAAEGWRAAAQSGSINNAFLHVSSHVAGFKTFLALNQSVKKSDWEYMRGYANPSLAPAPVEVFRHKFHFRWFVMQMLFFPLFPFCFVLQIDVRGSQYHSLEFFLPAPASNPPTLTEKALVKAVERMGWTAVKQPLFLKCVITFTLCLFLRDNSLPSALIAYFRLYYFIQLSGSRSLILTSDRLAAEEWRNYRRPKSLYNTCINPAPLLRDT